ncbi:MAG: radical SAM protein [Candidatus Aenigmarchaeota archaeon]|nr:radical SAM protein [Candidatus Aenigmarchaeota archaeon]
MERQESHGLGKTYSICPDCLKEGRINKIEADRIEENGKIFMLKQCDKHGTFKELIWDDAKLYKKYMKSFTTGSVVKDVKPSLYDEHLSQSVLTNLFVTNRCDMRCSYCFANSGAEGFVYEPSLSELKREMQMVRKEKPVASRALQVTGGEPMMRDDIIEIIKIARELGFTHVQVNTNTVRISENPELAKKLKESGVNTIYMSFDGVTKKANPLIDVNKKAIESFRAAKIGAVLVPTVIKTQNDHELGKIIRFAAENVGVVRGVNFQPISFVGRIEKINEGVRKKCRITYSEMLRKIEKQTNGAIKKDDWYPVPFVLPISKLVESLKGREQVEFTCSPACGGATYVYVDNGNMTPITRFIDVEGFMSFIEELSRTKGLFKRAKIASALLKNVNRYIDKEKAPKELSLGNLLTAALTGSYDKLGDFHRKFLYIGSMWFQDSWNLDTERLERCVIHYATPEGIIPFCAYNGLGIGTEIRKRHSMPVKEWEQKTGKKISKDLWPGIKKCLC